MWYRLEIPCNIVGCLICHALSHDFVLRTGNMKWELSKHRHRVERLQGLCRVQLRLECTTSHLGSCEAAGSDPMSLGWGLGLSVSNKVAGDALRTVVWIAGYRVPLRPLRVRARSVEHGWVLKFKGQGLSRDMDENWGRPIKGCSFCLPHFPVSFFLLLGPSSPNFRLPDAPSLAHFIPWGSDYPSQTPGRNEMLRLPFLFPSQVPVRKSDSISSALFTRSIILSDWRKVPPVCLLTLHKLVIKS